MSRSLATILACLALTFGLAACDDDEAEIETTEGEVEVETD